MTLQNVELKDVSLGLENHSGINAGRSVVGWDNVTGVIHLNGIRVNLGTISVSRIKPSEVIRADLTLYCEGTTIVKRMFQVSARCRRGVGRN
jgi:hypothetical protein